jgi:hypothetical protein
MLYVCFEVAIQPTLTQKLETGLKHVIIPFSVAFVIFFLLAIASVMVNEIPCQLYDN